ncbi:signal peptidase I [Agromyces sp. MMS24-K17]|uniref:signal peptidase I n=1 Tax=Agromyces sp. MMS24-K17 TaxID=3372850 RepID=UPI0037548709
MPGWRRTPIDDLPWPVLIRVALCRGLVVMVITLAAAAFLPRPFGFVGTTIITGSMQPSIQPGDVALVFPLPADEYVEGQVILFPDPADPTRQLLHRLVEIASDGSFVTQGDANRSPDSTRVDPATVIGVGRILVPSIGLPIVWAASGFWLLTWAALIVGVIVVRGTLTIEFFPAPASRRPPAWWSSRPPPCSPSPSAC